MADSTESPFNRPYGPVTLAELTAGLVWPRLFRAFALSVRPSRLMLGTVCVALLWWLARLLGWAISAPVRAGDTGGPGAPERVLMDVGEGLAASAGSAVVLDWRGALNGLSLAWTSPGIYWTDSKLSLTLFAVVGAAIWVIVGAAISRMVALEIAGGFDLSVKRGLVFALRRTRTLLFAVLLPLGVVAAVALGLRAAGWVLFSLPGVSVLGAVLFPVLWLLALLGVLILVAYIFGQSLIVPGVAVEGTDAVDAIQRAYSYVLGRPGRLILYSAVILVQGAIALVLVSWLIDKTTQAASWLPSAWLADDRKGVLVKPEAVNDATATILEFWRWLAGMLVAGWGVSFYFCSSTLLYLLLRRACDEQDVNEVWMPGMVGGTMAPTSRDA